LAGLLQPAGDNSAPGYSFDPTSPAATTPARGLYGGSSDTASGTVPLRAMDTYGSPAHTPAWPGSPPLFDLANNDASDPALPAQPATSPNAQIPSQVSNRFSDPGFAPKSPSNPDVSFHDLNWGLEAESDEPPNAYWPLVPRFLQSDLARNSEGAQGASSAPNLQGGGPSAGEDERESVGQRLLQSSANLIPGRYYGRLAAEQLHAGNYGSAAAYEAAAMLDAGLAAITLGGSASVKSLIGSGGSVIADEASTLARSTRAASDMRTGGATAEDLGSLRARAREVHGALDSFAQRRRTTAILRTEGGDIVASGGRDLSGAQQALLTSGEIGSKLPGAHAEATALSAALKIGLRPRALVTSRPICRFCAEAIKANGGTITSPTTAVFDP
jgi:hypothetical protein